MNLTKSDRDTFVRAVMQDVPSEDYDEMAKVLILAEVDKLLPEALRAAIKADESVLDHLDVTTYHRHGFTVMFRGRSDMRYDMNDNKALQDELIRLTKLDDAQSDRLRAVRTSILGVIASCRTLKQAKERLPEFEKYLPAERAPASTANLPVANVVAELTKLGWPKDKKAA